MGARTHGSLPMLADASGDAACQYIITDIVALEELLLSPHGEIVLVSKSELK